MKTTASVWTKKTIYNFGMSQNDGSTPLCQLTFDSAGNLYGTTSAGGLYTFGTVFALSPGSNGNWTETKLHDMTGASDGSTPLAGLTLDGAGNLFGTTSLGGGNGGGVAFELSFSDGQWTLKTLHNFGSGLDGANPQSRLLFDASGNLYGTTMGGGDYCGSACGTAFVLSPNGNGTWSEKKIHNFGSSQTDGAAPVSGLAADAAGTLYGTTPQGGNSGIGTVYKLVSNGSGWTESKLTSLVNTPSPSVILDSAGNIYGVALAGGDFNQGTVFEVTP